MTQHINSVQTHRRVSNVFCSDGVRRPAGSGEGNSRISARLPKGRNATGDVALVPGNVVSESEVAGSGAGHRYCDAGQALLVSDGVAAGGIGGHAAAAAAAAASAGAVASHGGVRWHVIRKNWRA